MALPTYTALSRRPPFTGLSRANATAKDYAGATEAVNVRFSLSDAEKDSMVESRPGWRKLAQFSTRFSDFLEFREPYTKAKHSAQPGAMLWALDGMQTLAPTRLRFSNGSLHRIDIRRDETGALTVIIDDVSTSVSTCAALLALFTAASITLDASQDTLALTASTTFDGILFSSVSDLQTSESTFYLEGLSLLKTLHPNIDFERVSTGSEPAFLPPIACKAALGNGAYSFAFASRPDADIVLSTDYDGAFYSDGSKFDRATLSGAVSASGGGARYADFAVQIEMFYAPIDPTVRSLSEKPFEFQKYVTGPLSERVPMSTATDAALSYSVGVTGYHFGAFATYYQLSAGADSIQLRGVPAILPNPEIPGSMRQGRQLTAYSSTYSRTTYADIVDGSGAGTKGYAPGGFSGSVPVGIGCRAIIWKTKNQDSAALAAAAPLYKVTTLVQDSSSSPSFTGLIDEAGLTEIYLPRPVEPESAYNSTDGLSRGPRTTAVCLHQTRSIIGTVDGQVQYSLPDEHLNFAPSIQYLQFDGKISALASVNEVLYVFTVNGIFAVTGALGSLDSTVTRISNITLQDEGGTISSQASTCVVDTRAVFFVGSDESGYVITDGQVVQLPNFSKHAKFMNSSTAPSVRMSRLRTTYCARNTSIAIGNVGDTEIDVLDKAFRWTKFSLPGALLDLQSLDGRMAALVSSPEGSELWQLSDDWGTDQGTDIEWRYASQWEDLEDPRTQKQFHALHLDLAEGASQNTELTVRTEYDYLPGKLGTEIDVALRVGQGWGNQAWGRAPWGDKNQAQVVVPLSNEKHRSMRVIFSGTKNLAISGWSIEAIGTGASAKNGTSSTPLT